MRSPYALLTSLTSRMEQAILTDPKLKAGFPPGTAVIVGGTPEPTVVTVYRLSPDGVEAVEMSTGDATQQLAQPGDPAETVWIDVVGFEDLEGLVALATAAGLHPLQIEDIFSQQQRARVEELDNGLLCFAWQIEPIDDGEIHLHAAQVTLLGLQGLVVSFRPQRRGTSFDHIRQRMNTGHRLRTSGAGYLFYALLDAIVDDYFVCISELEQWLDALPERWDRQLSADDVVSLLPLRALGPRLRQYLLPLVDAVYRLRTEHPAPLTDHEKPYLGDLYEHCTRLSDAIERLDNNVNALMDLQFNLINLQTNQVMRVLTVITAIFVPITFLAGVYGMNFDHLPELHWRYGYFMFWGVAVLIAVSLTLVFRRRGWF